MILLALKLQPRCLRLRGRSHIRLATLNVLVALGGVLRIAEDAGVVVVVARGRWLLLPLIILLLILEAARILTLLRSKCIFGLWL